MIVSEDALLRSGFSSADLRKVKNNLESYGGSLGDAIQDLSRRFTIALTVVLCCLAIFIFCSLLAPARPFFPAELRCSAVVRLPFLYNRLCCLISPGDTRERTEISDSADRS